MPKILTKRLTVYTQAHMMVHMKNTDALAGAHTVYIIAENRVMVGQTVSETQTVSVVRYVDLDGATCYVQRLNRAIFNPAHDAGEELDAEAKVLDL